MYRKIEDFSIDWELEKQALEKRKCVINTYKASGPSQGANDGFGLGYLFRSIWAFERRKF